MSSRDAGRRRPRRRAYIVIPFLVVSIAVAALAFRSYQLSVRAERGLSAFATQYLHYSAEITARNLERTLRNEMAAATEEWQQIERGLDEVDLPTLQVWIGRYPWILSAMYVADGDPDHSIFVTGTSSSVPLAGNIRRSEEFFTAGGSLRYTYDSLQLLNLAVRHVALPDLPGAIPEARELRAQSRLHLVRQRDSLRETGTPIDPWAVAVVRLAPPFTRFAVRASIQNPFVGRGLQNQQNVTIVLTFAVLLLTAAGARFALRGLKREAEAMKLRAALIANVSHELRTPLAMIRLGAETLKRSSRFSPEERSDLEDSILREVLHLSHLVENVLDIARLQKSGKSHVFRPVDPVSLVREVVTTYDSWIRSKGFSIEFSHASGIPRQMWDGEAVSRAVLNLIDNAIKYSSREKTVFVWVRQSGGEIEIAVKDRGVGIPADEISRIFEPYYRAQFSDTETRRGAGLGLTLVSQILGSHGGRVEVDSDPGHGSTFRLLFPKKKVPDENEAQELLRAAAIS